MKQWKCIMCSFIYDEELGLPDSGIAPGTAWYSLPNVWVCPGCGSYKAYFKKMFTD